MSQEGNSLIIPAGSLGNAQQVVLYDTKVKAIARILLLDTDFMKAAQYYQYQNTLFKYIKQDHVDTRDEYRYFKAENEFLQLMTKKLMPYYPNNMSTIEEILVFAHNRSDEYVQKQDGNTTGNMLMTVICYTLAERDVYENWPEEIMFLLPDELIEIAKD